MGVRDATGDGPSFHGCPEELREVLAEEGAEVTVHELARDVRFQLYPL